MANKSGKKGKKPLQTTLGKASCQNEKEMDLSHIRKPIHTSIFGLRQVLSLFQTATEEVQNYITHECDIMYECKMCRTIFRSLANFILHKRNYCRERFSHLDLLYNNENSQEAECSSSTQERKDTGSRPVTPEQKEPTGREVRKSLSPIIEKLKEKQEIHQLAQDVLHEDLSAKEVVDEFDSVGTKERKSNDVLLEKIATNNAAVFQTMLQELPAQQPKKPEYMKSEVMEIHGILENDEAVLGPDGKICNFETNKINKNPVIPKGDLFCTQCNLKFSTKKTLTYHIKYKHNNTRLVYVCPDCKDTFANAWCVYRHLYKIHRRTSAQIKRMREQIHNGYIRRDQEPAKKKDKKSQEKVDKTDEENQWLNNIEGDNDFQMCGGCGKRFERKAALHSHAQMCVKRIAVCNTIKENNAKKKEEECRENKNKISKPDKPGPSEVLKGSSKRKPYLLRTYKPNDKAATDKELVIRTEDCCDVNANCEIVQADCDSEKVKEEKQTLGKESTKEPSVSPSKVKDTCGSPSVEKIDTEKMLHIIGIPSAAENLTASIDSDETPCPEEKSTETRSHTASDFDTFCQNIADELGTDLQRETDSSSQKTGRTIPLILRRRNSSRPEKKNCILTQSRELTPVKEQSETNNSECNLEDKECNMETEDPTKSNESDCTAPSTSTFRISVKSLEDLIGVPTENHMKNPEVKDAPSDENQVQYIDVESISDLNLPLPSFLEVSDTIRANVSPEKLQRQFPKSLKRKRTSSFDYTRANKSLKQPDTESLSNKQDVSFISRASPYMDQNKLLCIPCQISYASLPKLLWHMSAHFSWFRFQCSRCSFISFNKLDCANHARRSHNVKTKSMQSVVLPIPNWKTILMAHEFCALKDDNDLSGKHTDEVMYQEDPVVADEDVDKKEHVDEVITDWYDSLFVDWNNLDSEPENSVNAYEHRDSIIQENGDVGIDVVDDEKDLFQVEVPQEIYTLDLSEITSVAEQDERLCFASRIKSEKTEDDETDSSYCASEKKENDTVAKVKTETASDDETDKNKCHVKTEEDVPEAETTFKPAPNFVVNVRPTRNRTRSVKTLQTDFFYDLSKVIKLNDSSVGKPALQKQRKSNNSSQKGGKESVSSSSKNDTKPLRVYSKKK